MPGPTILNSSVPEEIALRDTQVDEYYTDTDPEGCDDAYESIAENPYPGIRPFRTTEYVVFFGRDGISSDLIKSLSKHRFLPVLGSSGTGKSSLIRAGLLPVLETIPGKNGSWKVVICRPGKNPFGNLARAIAAAKITADYNEFEIWKILSSSSYGYQQLYSAIDTSIFYNTLIIIDQFEELFRYRNDYGVSGRNGAALFVKMLIDASQNEKLNTYVLITMRSEYLGDCVQLPQLVDAINKGQYLVPRLKSKQLADVIEQPADYSGATLEEGYASKLIGEVGDNMDQLPVLQHVLRRAYEKAKHRATATGNINVTYEDYLQVGGMDDALNKHANEVYDTLGEKQKEYCKILFQSITDKTTDGRGIRRPLTFRTILNICDERAPKNIDRNQLRSDLEFVVDSFRKDNVNFLMPPPHVKISDDLEIDISHESLMRTWKELHPWIDEEARDAALLNELMSKSKEEYIDGDKLNIFDEWKKRKTQKIAWATLYKKTDVSIDDYRLKFDDALHLITLNKRRKKNNMLIWIGAAAFIFLSLVVSAIFNHQKNDQLQKNQALTVVRDSLINSSDLLRRNRDSLNDKQTELNKIISILNDNKTDLIAKNQKIHNQADSLDEQIKENRNALDSLNKVYRENKINLAKAENLNRQKDSLTYNLIKKSNSLDSAYISASKLRNFALAIKHSQKSLAIPTYDANRENIKSYLALQAYQLYQHSGEEENKKNQPQVYSALYYALRRAVNKSYPDVWQVTSYNAKEDHLAYAAVGVSTNNHLVGYLTAEDKKLYSFDIKNRDTNMVAKLSVGNKLVSVTASSDGKWLAINTLSRKLLLIDNGNNRQDTINLTGITRTMKFSLDNTTLYVYTQDSLLTTITLSGKSRSSLRIKYNLDDIAVSNKFLYGLTTKGEILKWSRTGMLSQSADPAITSGKISYRSSVINCTPDDSLIIWGNEHGQVFYKRSDTTGTQYLTRFSGRITSIAFDDAFSMVAVGSYDKTIQVFNLPNLQSEVPLSLNNNEGPVTSLFFHNENNNKNLVAVLSPGIVREYPMTLNTLACRLYEYYKTKKPSAEEISMYLDKSVENRNIEIQCQ